MRKFINNFLESVEFLLNGYLDNSNQVFNPPTEYERMVSGFTKEDKIKFYKANHMLTIEKYSEVEILKENGEKITLSIDIWSEDKKGKI